MSIEYTGYASNEMVESYIETALWASTISNQEGTESVPLDDLIGPDDLPESWRTMAQHDCHGFVSAIEKAIREATSSQREILMAQLEECADSQVGHDFWLTRERHGAGFWDGDYPEPLAKLLTDVAHAEGNGGDDLDSAICDMEPIAEQYREWGCPV